MAVESTCKMALRDHITQQRALLGIFLSDPNHMREMVSFSTDVSCNADISSHSVTALSFTNTVIKCKKNVYVKNVLQTRNTVSDVIH